MVAQQMIANIATKDHTRHLTVIVDQDFLPCLVGSSSQSLQRLHSRCQQNAFLSEAQLVKTLFKPIYTVLQIHFLETLWISSCFSLLVGVDYLQVTDTAQISLPHDILYCWGVAFCLIRVSRRICISRSAKLENAK